MCPPSTRTILLQEVCDLLSEIWKLEVLCDCVDAGVVTCVGDCLQQSRRALGVHMTVGGGQSCTVTHPSALTDTWDLRYGAPLISPTRAPKEYLPCILISSLTWYPPLARNLGCPDPVGAIMGLAGNAVRVHANDRDVCVAQSSAPCACRLPVVVRKHYVRRVQRWPRPALPPKCSGSRYTDREIPTDFQPEGCSPPWCEDIALLRSIAAMP